MARQMDRYEVRLAFTADNSQAMQSIQALEKSLQNVAKMPFNAQTPFKSLGLEEASDAAIKLQRHLRDALNVDTGKLDLSRLSTSLKSANENLDDYYTNLLKAGPAGEQAFMDLAKAITQADTPVIRLNNRFQEFAKTLKNTIKWQLSSDLTHGLQRAISTAYNYAQNLNESLNNIRIVTGHNIEYMDKFANKANKAAKALSATTLDYTNSALTYYQMGLSDDQVEARTAITLKMANASGVAAETVAQQLTAVWNNFSKGTDDLEHFADAMVRLGADTASSTDEISEGLQKFAATAQTIGLSFDNAAAALATITATTRESASIVGNALRTLFARIQGLNLGETLEDGTTLNKYSEALEKVGVNIKTTSGELKDMDVILNEMGEKWKTLGKDQQTALAQVVGGTRQYQQVMNLMNNFDFYKENVARAQSADGSLQEQADIYAEGWEAARDRVKASMEGIYDALINDQFFIDLSNFISTLLDGVKDLTKGFGGLKGILTMVSSVALGLYAKEMPKTLQSLKQNFLVLTGQSDKLMVDINRTTHEKMRDVLNDPTKSDSERAAAINIQQLTQMREKLVAMSGSMTEAEQEEYKLRIKNVEAIGQEIVALEKRIEKTKEAAKEAKKGVSDTIVSSFRETENKYKANKESLNANKQATSEAKKEYNANNRRIEANNKKASDLRKQIGTINGQITKIDKELDTVNENLLNPKTEKDAKKELQDRKKELEYRKKRLTEKKKPLTAQQKENDKDTATHEKRNTELEAQMTELDNQKKSLETEAKANRDKLDNMVKAIYDKRATYEGKTKDGQEITEDQIKNAVEKITDGYTKIITAQTNTAKKGEDLQLKLNDLANENLDKLDVNTEAGAERFAKLKTSTQEYLQSIWKSLKEDASLQGYSEEIQKQINEAINEAYNASLMVNEGTQDPQKLEEAVQRAQVAMQTLNQLMGENGAAAQALAREQEQAFGDMAQEDVDKLNKLIRENAILRAKIAQLQQGNIDNSDENPEHQAQAAEGYTKLASGILATINVFSSAKTAFSNLTDESASASEGLTSLISVGMSAYQTFTMLSDAARILGMSFSTISIIIGALYGVIAIVKAIQAASPAGQIKELTEKTQVLKSSLEETKKGAEELKTSFDNYIEIKNKLDSCVKGTLEWKEALDETNQQILEILQNFPDLIDYISRDIQTGLLTISDEGFKLYESRINESYNRIGLQFAQMQNQKNNLIAENNFRESLGDNGNFQKTSTYFLQTFVKNNYKDIINSTADEIKQLYDKQNTTSYESINFDKETIDALKEYASTLNKNQKSVEVQTETYLRGLLDSNKAINNSKYANNLYIASSSLYNRQFNQAKKSGQYGTTAEKKQLIADTYGVDLKDVSWNWLTGNYSYKKDGEKVKVSAEDATALWREDSSLTQTEKILETLVNKFENWGSSGDVKQKGLIDFFTSGTFENMSVDNFTKLKGTSIDDLMKIVGNDASQYGFENLKALKEALVEALSLKDEDAEKIANNLSNNMSYATAIALKDSTEDLSNKGRFMWDQLMSGVKDASQGLTNEQQNSLWSQIANVDFNSWDFDEKIKGILTSFGISSQELGDNWDSMVQHFKKIEEIGPGLDKLKATLDSVNDIVNDIELGSILSKEDYNTLVQYNAELSKYFMILSDGTAQMIGNIFDLSADVKNNAIKEYTDRINALKDAAKEAADTYNTLIDAGDDLSAADKNAAQAALDKYNKVKEERNSQKQLAQNELAIMLGDDTDKANELFKQGTLNQDAMIYRAKYRQNQLYGENLDVEDVQDYADYLAKLADSEEDATVKGRKLSKELTTNSKAARQVAAEAKLTQKGIELLANNLEDWQKALKKSQKGTTAYEEALGELRTAASYLLNINEEFLSDDFLVSPTNMANFQKAIKGDADAIEALGKAASRDIVINLAGDDEELKDKFTTLFDDLVKNIPDVEIGATINDEDFVNQAAQMLDTMHATAEQAQAIFSGLNLHMDFPETKMQYIAVKDQLMDTVTESDPVEIIDDNDPEDSGDGGKFKPYTPPRYRQRTRSWQEPSNHWRTIQVPSYVDENGKSLFTLTKTSGGTLAAPGATKGGSSGGKSSKIKKSKKSDVVDRYKEITDKINDLTRAYDKASKAADRLYGKTRIDAMAENNKRLQEEIKLLKQKQKEADAYLKIDRTDLNKAAKAAGVSFSIDENNNITNYTTEMNRVYNELIKAQEKYNAFTNKDAQSNYKDKTLDPLQEKVDNLKEAISQFEETRNLIADLIDEQMDKFYEWQDKNLEGINYKLEIKLSLDTNTLNWLNYYFDKLADDIYKATEAFTILTDKFEPAESSLNNYRESIDSLNASLAAGEISMSGYIDAMQANYDGILSQLEALQDLDKQTLEYYGNTLALAQNELDKYTSKMDHLTNILDHYKSILSLLGKETDYDSINAVLGGKAQNERNRFEVSQDWYRTLKAQEEEAAQALANAANDAERELLQANYDAIVEKLQEAEEQMLSDAEAFGETLKEILQNKSQQAADLMNKALTKGMGWDALNDSMSRLSSYQDEYLTKTNQVYEMNKMLNTVNQAIDKTTNQAAKNRYNQFAKEIEQLRDKDKLSQLELEIAQAKYKILEAQIALEDAQNAKSIVRLQRDSEGNFGYVYTADQDKINDAEQNLADAENDLYNIRLKATNKYGEQALKYQQELAEKLAEIDQKANDDAIYREGNYQEDRKRIIDEYTQLINASLDLYRLAQVEDSRVVQDAWVNAYDYIIDKGDNWQDSIIDYTNNINDAFNDWQTNTDILTDLVGGDLDETTDKVKDLTDASNNLRDQVVDDIIPSLDSELNSVRELTEAWAQQRQEILNLIQTYEELLKYVGDTIQSSSGYGNIEFDKNADYSRLMTDAYLNGNMNDYETYKSLRNQKMQYYGLTNDSRYVSTDEIDQLLKQGYAIGQGQLANYDDYSSIPKDLLKRLLLMAIEAPGQLNSFATGGYTGEWDGDNGKLAVLHQKELVLNQNDTANLLTAVSIIHSIGSMIDRLANFSGLSSLAPTSLIGTTAQSLDQNVVINAEFPNATDRNEIAEAFNSLVNRASQFANRKNL